MFPILPLTLLVLNILLAGCQGTVLVGTALSGVLGGRVMRWSKAWIYAVVSYAIGSFLLFVPRKSTAVLPEGVQALSKSLALLMSLLGIIFKTPVSPVAVHCEFKAFLYIFGFGISSALLSFLLLWTRKDSEEPMVFSMKFAPFLYAASISIPGSLFVFKLLQRFDANAAILYSIPASILALSAAIIYSLCRYFTIPWLKKKAFAKYPQELLEFANTGKERTGSVDELPVVNSAMIESSDEIDTVVVVQQAGLNLPQSVLNRLMHSPTRRDVESGSSKRGDTPAPPPTKKEQDRDVMYRQNERALMTLRSEELYSVGLMINVCLMMASTQIISSSWTEGLLSILAGCLGIPFSRAMAKHLGRDLMQIAPSSAMLMITASSIVCAIGTVSGLPVDTLTCMTFNFLGLALMLHFRPPLSSKGRRKSDQSTKVAPIVRWKRLAIVLLGGVMSMVIGVSAVTGLLIVWPSKTGGDAGLVQHQTKDA